MEEQIPSGPQIDTEASPSPVEIPYPGCRDYIRETYARRSFPEEGIAGILASISEQTLKQYDCAYKAWWFFCLNKQVDPYMGVLENIICFLKLKFEEGCSFSVANSYKSALALVLQMSKDSEKMVNRFLKGLRNIRPPKARYSSTWDPHPVLNYLETLYPLDSLSLRDLTLKLVVLLALTTAHRMQTLTKIKISNIVKCAEYVEIFIEDKIKTSGRNSLQPVLYIAYFSEKPALCLASTIELYIEKTKAIRPVGLNTLIITIKKPFRAASSQTISRWIKSVLRQSGINTNLYSGYSIRHAAVSSADRAGVNIEVIRKAAGWSDKSSVFCSFYKRPIHSAPETFAKAVFKGAGVNMD
ncbi:unnamed protein product [Callosobruchus maculatus]|uniref:Tyr recombinase domain-containing protein n=1 Tax=Callosobruchus maculatus TaxID=64391 RepID=A0A653CGE0_CALMS|nr:unnamed protein product [Callosobruchus maculatus]